MRGIRLAFLLIIALGVWYWRLESGLTSGLQSGQQAKITGTISQLPTFKTDQFTGEEYQWLWISVGSETFGFRADRWGKIEYGDKVEIAGRLKLLESSKSPLTSFNLTPRRWVIDDAKLKVQNSNFKIGFLEKVRIEILELFRKTLPRNEAGLLSGMVLGTKGELSDEFRQFLQKSGTIHVVVASGFNVMLVAGMVASLAVIWVRRQIGVILGMGAIWFYVALVGFDAPVVRAGLMGSLAFLGIATGRVRDTGWLLVLSAVLMLWWRPEWLFDVGFQLSVAATAGLVWIEPIFRRQKIACLRSQEDRSQNENNRHSEFISESRGILKQVQDDATRVQDDATRVQDDGLRIFSLPIIGVSFRTTLAAQLAVLPILLHTFGEISVLSLLANAVVLWVVPIITGVGMLSGITPEFSKLRRLVRKSRCVGKENLKHRTSYTGFNEDQES